ncbi:hypothetical protein EVAR_4775_1 [Eumeta japonica]|uniref:Uncharacterized protein n=1 Tax=Eumeta variegata TaxID=151549 RepID=A0A4C1SYW9_EUMVA|nr:hypothetical protein EVAR_4775_1 [Eumeta japonica]
MVIYKFDRCAVRKVPCIQRQMRGRIVVGKQEPAEAARRLHKSCSMRHSWGRGARRYRKTLTFAENFKRNKTNETVRGMWNKRTVPPNEVSGSSRCPPTAAWRGARARGGEA